ncbi:SCO family protein [Duganella qianjiadongensis]|uniref:Redoxin domain-containing protein n=1 Tax=Duganella qianjiadongensis TaxID=2692176 RepID=A0ABW9VGK2_9BURK|nr:redoxin domain-containing protein [Duganella qianjiadongensis]
MTALPRRTDWRHWLAGAVLGACALAAQAVGLLYQMPYRWVDTDGQSLKLSQYQGKPVVLTLAYGACKKICSSSIYAMEQMQVLADRHKTELQFVIVSLDPEQDTPADWRELRKTRKLQRPNWNVLSGSVADTRALAAALGITVWRYHDHVLHDFGIALLDANGNIVRTMRHYDDSIPAFLQGVLATPATKTLE